MCPPKNKGFVPNKEVSLNYNEMITKSKIVSKWLDKRVKCVSLYLQGEIHRIKKDEQMKLSNSLTIYRNDNKTNPIQVHISQHLIGGEFHQIMSSLAVALSVEEAERLIAELTETLGEVA